MEKSKTILAGIKLGTPFERDYFSINWSIWADEYSLVLYSRYFDENGIPKVKSQKITDEQAIEIINNYL